MRNKFGIWEKLCMTTDKTSITNAKDKNKTRETTKVHFYERMLSRNFARCYFLKPQRLFFYHC